jgi:hypothetical protein
MKHIPLTKFEQNSSETGFQIIMSSNFIALCETYLHPSSSKKFLQVLFIPSTLLLLRRQDVESSGNLLLPRETVLAVDLGVRTKVLALRKQTSAKNDLVIAKSGLVVVYVSLFLVQSAFLSSSLDTSPSPSTSLFSRARDQSLTVHSGQ